MTKVRPTIKGRGADFFLAEGSPKPTEQGKSTFYLPKALIDKLDDVWLDLRRTHKKLKKSDIARIALDETLRDYEENHQDSTVLEYLNVKTSQQ